ncbi:MAG: hypothetical protein ACMXYF_02025 [Candidatus Woesearchaeota archaeon]
MSELQKFSSTSFEKRAKIGQNEFLTTHSYENMVYSGQPLIIHKHISPAILGLLDSCPSIRITKKAEWLFLCGRDIFVENVLTSPIPKGFVLVRDDNENILGLAKQEKDIMKNILDKGHYIRRELKKRK